MAGEIKIKVGADATAAIATAKRVGGAFKSALDEANTSVSKLRSSVSGLTTAFGALAGIGIVAGFKQLAGAALQSAINLDKTRQQMIALTRSTEEPNKKIAELKKLAEVSPGVTTTFATQLFSQLKAVGTIADQTINKVITGLGKLNAVFGIDDPQGFARNLVQVFTQSFERSDIKEALGRVTIFEQLLESAFGTKDPDKLRQLKEAGTLTLETFLSGFIEAINKRFPQATEGIGGQLAKLKEKILVELAPLGEEIGKILLPILKDIVEQVEKFGPKAVKAFGEAKDGIVELTREIGNLIGELGKLIAKLAGLDSDHAFRDFVNETVLLIASARDILAGDIFTGPRTRAAGQRLNRAQDRAQIEAINAADRAANVLNTATGFLPDPSKLNTATGTLPLVELLPKDIRGRTGGRGGGGGGGGGGPSAASRAAKKLLEASTQLRDAVDESIRALVEDLETINKDLREQNELVRQAAEADAARPGQIARRSAILADRLRQIDIETAQLEENTRRQAAETLERTARRGFRRAGEFAQDALGRGQITAGEAQTLNVQAARQLAQALRERLAAEEALGNIAPATLADLRDEINLYDRLGTAVSDSERFMRGFNSAIETSGDIFERFGQRVSQALTSTRNLLSGLKQAILGLFNDLLGNSLQTLVRGVLGPLFGGRGGGGGGGGIGGFFGSLFGGGGGGNFLTGGFAGGNPAGSILGGGAGGLGLLLGGDTGAGVGFGTLPRSTGFGSILPTGASGLSGLLSKLGVGQGGILGSLGIAAPLLGGILGAGVGGTSTLGKIAGAIGGGAIGVGAAFGASILGAGGGIGQALLAFAGPAAFIGIPLLVGAFFLGRASQRRKDEAASGEFLTQALNNIRELRRQVEVDQIDGSQARGIFENQILAQFIQQISGLKTKSVRESRLTNQVRDLRAVFDAELTPAIEAQKKRRIVNKSLIPEFAIGGIVRGRDMGFDSVAALLRPGEMVLTREQQGAIAAMAGAGVFQAAGVPDAGIQTPGGEAFQFGGRVGSGGAIHILFENVTLNITEEEAGRIVASGVRTDTGERATLGTVRRGQNNREL